MTTFKDDFLDEYFAECGEHLAVVRRGLLSLEQSVGRSRPDKAITEELFRSFHSLKGLAGMVEDPDGELLAHEMESYLRAIREGDVRLTTHGVEVLIEGTRWLEHTIAARREGSGAPDSSAALASLRALVGNTVHHERARRRRRSPRRGGRALVGMRVHAVAGADRARRQRRSRAGAAARASERSSSAAPLVGADGAVAFRFLFAGSFDEAAIEGWTADGMICSRLDDAAGRATWSRARRSLPLPRRCWRRATTCAWT